MHGEADTSDVKPGSAGMTLPIWSRVRISALCHEGLIVELSTWFYLDVALPKSTEGIQSKTLIFNIKMIDTHIKS